MNNEKPHSHNFWSGFSVGMLAGGALMYVFATKRGRKLLQDMLENSDSIENNIESILKTIEKTIVVDKDEDKKETKKK